MQLNVFGIIRQSVVRVIACASENRTKDQNQYVVEHLFHFHHCCKIAIRCGLFPLLGHAILLFSPFISRYIDISDGIQS